MVLRVMVHCVCEVLRVKIHFMSGAVGEEFTSGMRRLRITVHFLSGDTQSKDPFRVVGHSYVCGTVRIRGSFCVEDTQNKVHFVFVLRGQSDYGLILCLVAHKVRVHFVCEGTQSKGFTTKNNGSLYMSDTLNKSSLRAEVVRVMLHFVCEGVRIKGSFCA